MVDKKIFMAGIFILVGVLVVGVLVVSLVSAKHAWWHAWGEEVQEAPFDATVQLANAPPTIVAFRPTDDFLTSGAAGPGTGLGDVGAIGNVEIWARIIFIVEDPNQPNDLPGLGTGPAINVGPLSGAGNILASITSPADAANSIRCAAGSCRTRTASSGTTAGTDYPSGLGLTRSCVATTCAGGTNTNCPCTSATNPGCAAISPNAVGSNNELQVQYTCYVKMNYWDEPTTSDATLTANDYWTIRTQIEDSAASSDNVASGDLDNNGVPAYDFNEFACTTINNCDYIDHLSVKFLDTTGSVGWTAVSIDAGDDPADTATDLAMTNKGNSPVPSISLTGADLIGVASGGSAISNSIMRVNAFVGNEVTGEVAAGAQCSDTTDNDADTFTDFPADPQCRSTLDNSETTLPAECGSAVDPLVVATAVTITGVNIPFTAGGAADLGTVDADNIYFCLDRVLSSSTCSGTSPCLSGPLSSRYAAKTDAPNGFTNPWAINAV